MVKIIRVMVMITAVLLLTGCSGHENKIVSSKITPQVEFFDQVGYQNPEIISNGWMIIYLWGEIENAGSYTGEEIKEYVENQYNVMYLSTSEGEFEIKNSLLSIEDKDDETYMFSYAIYIDPIEEPFEVCAVKYFDKNDNNAKVWKCGRLEVLPRYYCEPKIAFCYESPVKALENNGKEYSLTYYVALPTLKENIVNFEVEGEYCSVKKVEEDLEVEKELISLYENDKSKEELAALRAYRIDLDVCVEQYNTILDPIIQIKINDTSYSCMTHPIILNCT